MRNYSKYIVLTESLINGSTSFFINVKYPYLFGLG